MIQSLPFYPQPSYTIDSEPKRISTEYGDGYMQRATIGLNPLLRQFSGVTFNLRHAQADQLLTFLTTHRGVTPFYFRKTAQSPPIKVVCAKWSETVGKTHSKISCDFEETL